jgi:hypothetical protein
VTPGGRYLVGIAAVAVAAQGLSFVLSPDSRRAVWFALGLGLAVQGPLGWWLVRAIGTERFLPVWAGGIAARLAVLGAGGFVAAPRLGFPLEPTLVALVGVLMSFVGVEAFVAWFGARGTEAR